MIEPKEGKLIRPSSKYMWAKINDGEVKVIFLQENTTVFLEELNKLCIYNDLKLVKIELHSVLFPTLYFKDPISKGRSATVYYEDRHWNFQTSDAVILDTNTIKEAVLPFLTFMDEHAVGVNYKLVVEYLGLNNEEGEDE